MRKKRILLPSNIAQAGLDLARRRDDVEATIFDDGTTPEGLRPLLHDADGIALNYTRFGENELKASPSLQVVGRIGVGYDTVDVAALTRYRIPLMTTGTANTTSVAEQTVAFMMALAKKSRIMDAMVREGRWEERLSVGPTDLFGKAVLIVGFGRIGMQTAKRCLAMEMSVLVHDPYVSEDTVAEAGCEWVAALDDGVGRADFVAVLCPKTSETVNLFDAARLARMKPVAYFINTARGGMVDEMALYDALANGRLAGAALDVFEREPPEATNPLLTLSNFVTAPHLAGVTREALDRMAIVTVQNILSVLDGRPNRENVHNREVLA